MDCVAFFSQRSTFQCVLAVGDDQMFIIYLYKTLMRSSDGSSAKNFDALVGYTCANHSDTCFYEHPSSLTDRIIEVQETSNCDVPGQWIFNIKGSKFSVVCPEVPNLINGNVVYTYDVNGVSPYHVGAIATHSCASGYRLDGPEVRICEKVGTNGVWSGETPTCKGELWYVVSHFTRIVFQN